MTSPLDNDDLFRFADEAADTAVPRLERPWQILVVDDDADVHQTTRFSLNGLHLFDRPLTLLHASSAREARTLLKQASDIAVVLLDVVMETPDAGLGLIDHIRNDLGMAETRIVLRTGQPGYAPEHETLLRYDINDYKTKSELTHHKLLTTVTTTVRAYQQLCQMAASRRGLERIVADGGAWRFAHDSRDYAHQSIEQMADLLNIPPKGLVCAPDQAQGGYRVMAAAGPFADWLDMPLATGTASPAPPLLLAALAQGDSRFGDHEAALWLGPQGGLHLVAYLRSDHALGPLEVQLLQVLASNLTAGFDNLELLQRLQRVAYEDPLLKLPNRARMVECLNECKHLACQGKTLLLADVDDFASINDLMGHEYGDRVLAALAARLQALVGSQTVLARVSGNAFGLLGDAGALEPERILAAFEEPILIQGQPQRVSLSLGICDAANSDADGAGWLKNASIALKQAKREQRGRHVRFTHEMAVQARHRAQLLSALHLAFGHQHLFLVYQPQLELQTGRLIGLEALLRWRNPEGQFISPDQFIPVAEQSGLIVHLGDWVLNQACHTMRGLVDAGLAPLRMAVNVSVVQFQSPGFVERVQAAIEAAGLHPAQLELEITESVSLLGQGVIESMLQVLRSIGVSVAIDDFGMGYSSLSYLEKLPLDRIKIDKAFVAQLSGEGSPRVAELIAQLGLKLGLRILAEGIEDAQAWTALQSMGVHEGQGYHIARPMDAAQLLGWLRDRPQLFAAPEALR